MDPLTSKNLLAQTTKSALAATGVFEVPPEFVDKETEK